MINQIFIFVFGALAIWLVSRTEKWRRWGYIFGLCGQPFWFWTTVTTEQWGMVALCAFYTYSWGQGVWNYWIKPSRNA